MPRSDERIRARLDFLEWEAREHPKRHALRLLGLAAVGYLYPAMLLAGSISLVAAMIALARIAWETSADGLIALYLAALVGSLLLAAAVLRTFWVRLPEPGWPELARDQAPQLRAAIDELRANLGAPRVHHIHISHEFNAAASQRPRFGFWGPRINYLTIGMPLLIALDVPRLRIVLAHELGHLRGRHSTFGSWIYRVYRTWDSLAAPFKTGGRMRRFIMGWFVNWYGEYFGISTLALRRIYEYEADRRSAEIDGAATAADSLLAISWLGYRLEKSFWPALIHQASRDPLPPGDILPRIRDFLASEPNSESMQRWRNHELRSRTPVTSDHPCLIDRLAGLEQADRLQSGAVEARIDPQASAIALLGDARDRLWSVANASWKALAINRWRMEHYLAKQTAEASKKATEQPDPWKELEANIDRAPLEESIDPLREFLATSPEHAAANFTLGRVLLSQDDESAAEYLETAMRNDSDYIGPSLQMLLEYYRAAGRDSDADPIRRRLEDHVKLINQARKERFKVSRRDRFLPHGLKADDVEKLRRLVHRYPQIYAAHLVRKQVRLLAEKPSYVLAVERRLRLMTDSRKADRFLVQSLQSQVELPCAVVMLGWTSPALRRRVLRASGGPIYLAQD